jgi:hypothetical protein
VWGGGVLRLITILLYVVPYVLLQLLNLERQYNIIVIEWEGTLWPIIALVLTPFLAQEIYMPYRTNLLVKTVHV